MTRTKKLRKAKQLQKKRNEPEFNKKLTGSDKNKSSS
jgi:hypothetical protein